MMNVLPIRGLPKQGGSFHLQTDMETTDRKINLTASQNCRAKLASCPLSECKGQALRVAAGPQTLTLRGRPPMLPSRSARLRGFAYCVIKNKCSMEPQMIIHNTSAGLPLPVRRKQTIPDPDLTVPERGTTGPVRVGELMEPIQRIIAHPDRNRLMAEFFRRHW